MIQSTSKLKKASLNLKSKIVSILIFKRREFKPKFHKIILRVTIILFKIKPNIATSFSKKLCMLINLIKVSHLLCKILYQLNLKLINYSLSIILGDPLLINSRIFLQMRAKFLNSHNIHK